MTISDQITQKEAQVLSETAKLAPLNTTIGVLQRDLAGIVCRGSKQDKARCEGRKAEIRTMIASREAQRKIIQDQIKSLQDQVSALNKQRDSEGKAIETLAQQGLTPAAVLANTTAQAEAATQIAAAQARSIETGSANKQVIIWAIVVIVAIIILIFIRKKLA
jgi:chromosome segregation ATPase